MPTWSSAINLQGPPGSNGTAVRSGMGPPSATNPAIQQDGDFYYDISTPSPVFYGPRANGVWPSQGVNSSGSIIRSTQGVPQPSVGNVGDYAVDDVNGFWYGPKDANLGWLANPPVSIVGPQGPSGQVQPSFGTFSNGYGPGGYINGLSLSATPTIMNIGAVANMPNYFVPVINSAFMGAQIVNFGGSASSVTFSLYNNTTSTVVYTSSALAVGTIGSVGIFASTAYPLVAGNSYSWRVTGSGSCSCYIVPLYQQMCGASQGVSVFAPFTLNNVTLSGAATACNPAGFTANTMYYRSPSAGYLYSMQVTVTGTASASVTFAGYTTSVVTAANSPQYFGPFVAASNALNANTNYTATVTGSGTGNVIMIPSMVS